MDWIRNHFIGRRLAPWEVSEAATMAETDGQAVAWTPRRDWRWRLWRRLFPLAPRPVDPAETRTYLTTTIHVWVSWPDRLRLLVSGRALVQLVTYTDVEVKDARSVSVFSVEGP
jgi:hypothetical protein